MFFVYLILFFLIFYFSSYICNISLELSNVCCINFSNFIVMIWIIFSLLYINIYKKENSWISELTIYISGAYKSITVNLLSSIFILIYNIQLFFNFFLYNTRYASTIFNMQIWTPLFKRGGYFSLLNSSRSRWCLSKSNSIFKNK